MTWGTSVTVWMLPLGCTVHVHWEDGLARGPATVLACQSRGTLASTSTPADGGHRGSPCVYTKTKPVLQSPVQKACLQVEFGCILGSLLYFRKEIKVKGEKQSVCGALPPGRRGPGYYCTISHPRPMPCMLLGALEGSHDNTSPWEVHVQLYIPHPTQETLGSAGLRFQFQPEKAAGQKP